MKSLWVVGIVLGFAALLSACTMFSDSSEFAAETAKDTVLGNDTVADSNNLADQTGACDQDGRCEVEDDATCVDCFKKCDETDGANLGSANAALARSAQCRFNPFCDGSPCQPAECISNELGVRPTCGECIDSAVECGMTRCGATCALDFTSAGCLSCLDDKGCSGIVAKCLTY